MFQSIDDLVEDLQKTPEAERTGRWRELAKVLELTPGDRAAVERRVDFGDPANQALDAVLGGSGAGSDDIEAADDSALGLAVAISKEENHER